MKYIRIIMEEFKINVLEALSYRVGFVTDIIILGVLQTFLFIQNAGTSLSTDYGNVDARSLMYIGYLVWVFTCGCINIIAGEVRSEMIRGTFYQKLNSIISINFLLFGKWLSSLVITFATSLTLFLIAHFTYGVTLKFSFNIVIFIIICLFGMYGIGLFLGGLAVYFKQVSGIIYAFQTILLLGSDVLNKSDALFIKKYLPLAMCNDLIRKIYSGNRIPFADVIFFIVLCLVVFLIGTMFFNIMIEYSKRKGNLLHF